MVLISELRRRRIKPSQLFENNCQAYTSWVSSRIYYYLLYVKNQWRKVWQKYVGTTWWGNHNYDQNVNDQIIHREVWRQCMTIVFESQQPFDILLYYLLIFTDILCGRYCPVLNYRSTRACMYTFDRHSMASRRNYRAVQIKNQFIDNDKSNGFLVQTLMALLMKNIRNWSAPYPSNHVEKPFYWTHVACRILFQQFNKD